MKSVTISRAPGKRRRMGRELSIAEFALHRFGRTGL